MPIPTCGDLVHTVCKKLDLNLEAGLGWRLRQVTVEKDESRIGIYRLITNDIVEAMALAEALNVLANPSQVRFEASAIGSL
jgi:ribonuclease HI